MSPSGKHQDQTIHRHVSEFQRRLPQYERDQRAEGDGFKHNFISRHVSERLIRGDKITYDAMLQGMLSQEEHAQLETDPHFTKAWRIFVDLTWVKRQVVRIVLILVLLIIVGAVAAVTVLLLPQLIGPETTTP